MQGTITDENARPAADLRGGARTTKCETNAINDALTEKIRPQKFRIWFRNSTRLTLGDGYLKVGVPNLFIASWIENHFSGEIAEAVRAVTDGNRKITFTIDPELSGHQRRTQLDSQVQLVEKAQNRLRSRRTKARQPARKKLKLNLDAFVVGSSNRLAYNAARAVIDEEQSLHLTRYLSTDGTGLDLTPLFFMMVTDCYPRRIVGWTLDRCCRANERICAVRMGLESEGLTTKEACRKLSLRNDNGSQLYTQRSL